ncbi:hypothetical protein VHUM_02445 [Vanrija humicola]|uniref:NAD-dependent epimerase/dehydratase domain-containing protein n=1 Tax=Vanrija humicola TaxID=5417 RepID=A0A7D8V4Z5_VANHU|nr:hypothetical protein VHUM_02445 [Vanrija humicola]
MPAITSGRVLVTGANGFLGLYVVRALLASGFSVRFTVRSEAKAAFVRELFVADAERLESVIVEDMLAPGAYDAAVPGVDGIVHLASPVDLLNAGDPEAVIRPAVSGVENLLASIGAHGNALKRMVQISSVSALGGDFTPVARYDEASWNDESPRVVAELGPAADSVSKYNASKVLAERAFWDWIAARQPGWDGVAVLPSLSIGPDLQYALSGTPTTAISFALAPLLRAGIAQGQLGDALPFHGVDARDVAYVVVAALTTPQAGGERFIASAGPVGVNDVALAAEAAGGFANIAKGNAAASREALRAKSYVINGSKAERVLGFTYRPVRETLEETIKSLPAELFAA